MAADNVALARDDLARVKIMDVAADRLDAPDELVPDDHRHRNGLPCPIVPVEDVHVGPADGILEDADEHIVDANLRPGDFFEPEAGFSVALHERAHGLHDKSNIAEKRPAKRRHVRATRTETRLASVWKCDRLSAPTIQGNPPSLP